MYIYIYIYNIVRFVCEIVVYWTAEKIFPRKKFFESLWFGTDDSLLSSIQSSIPSQKIVFNKETNVKNW
jgi:hypothetical protein